MRIVLDTNVLVSGLMYPGSVPGRAVAAWLDGHFDLLLSVEQLAEIGRVLAYPKIRRILKWDRAVIEAFLKQLYVRSDTVDITDVAVEVPGDASDSAILATAIAGGADWLVTGDAYLLVLRDRYPILSTVEFVQRVMGETPPAPEES